MKHKAPFRKILVANRGEIAVRIIRTCRQMGIVTVAVYSDVDRDALHVRSADEAYHIGGSPPRESYLNIDRILRVAQRSKAEAVHSGYGFLSENPSFSEACEAQGLAFIGPAAATLRAVSDKITARHTVQAVGVPVVPGSIDSVKGHAEAAVIAETVGYPVLLKPAAGGGGKGMRIANSEDELRRAFLEAAGEASSAFGDSRLFVEKLVQPVGHVEVQLLVDNYGNAVHLGERDCSIQRRHQKVIEESPSPRVDDGLRDSITRAAIKVAEAVGYRNAGTVEFLVKGRNFYFIEVNARLQVEHPVTELVTGIDIVKEQILLAAGEPLRFRQDDIVFRGAALQCRIYAEDPFLNFTPSPGTIHALKKPCGPNVRIDSGVEAGSTVPMDYDGLLAKLVVWGSTRTEAISRMKQALSEFQIAGIATTIPFKRFVIGNELFLSGQFDTGFIDKIWEEWTRSGEAFRTGTGVSAAVPALRAEETSAGKAQPRQEDISDWKMLGRSWAMRRW